MTISIGQPLPTGFTFRYIDYSRRNDPGCKFPVPLAITSEFFRGKTVVIVAVPAAFSPTCSEDHIPKVLKDLTLYGKKHVDLIIVLSNNDAFVLEHWRRSLSQTVGIDLTPYAFTMNGIETGKKPQVLFASDCNTEFSKAIGFVQDSLKMGMGVRTTRYALIVKNGIVQYCEQERKPGVTVSGSHALLSKL